MKKLLMLSVAVAVITSIGTAGAISLKANLTDAESGAPVMDIPLEGSHVTVKAMETLGGPAEDLEVPVDGDGNVTVPAEGASGYWQIGL